MTLDGERRRPGGRSTRVREAVHRATLELLGESKWSELNVATVAERAGVHQATIYRRWGDLNGVIVDMLALRWATRNPIQDTGSLRGDLEAFALRSVTGTSGTLGLVALRALITIRSELGPEGGPAPGMFARRDEIESMLDRARARGEPTPSLDQVLEGILAPMYFRLLFANGSNSDDYARALVEQVLVLARKDLA